MIRRSHEVGVLHGHVVALLDEAIVVVDVATGTDDGLRASRVIDASSCLGSEASLARVKDDGVLKLLASRLVHRARSLLFVDIPAFLVKAWAGYFKLQTLSIEDLVVIEAW